MKRWYLFSGILAALLGLLIIIFPNFWIKLIVIVIGLASIGYGVYGLMYTKAISEDFSYRRTILIKSIVGIVAGAMAVLFPLAIGNAAWTVMTWFLIIYLLASAAGGFYATALLKDTGIDRKRYIIENLLLIVVAVFLILISPRDFREKLVKIIGIIIMLSGFVMITFDILSNRKSSLPASQVVEDESSEKEEEV